MKYPSALIDEVLFDAIAAGTFGLFMWGALTGKPVAWLAVVGGSVGLGIWPNLRRRAQG